KNKIKVSLDSSDQKLSTKLQVAWEEKIPLVVIVGQEECKQMKLTVKNQRLNKELKCSKEELLEVLLEELKEREEN
ncbi:His/Gly/Thr/Pro-type tRNA ligase C-terminal domain-containing protein, partial [Streptomyces caeruleatus]